MGRWKAPHEFWTPRARTRVRTLLSADAPTEQGGLEERSRRGSEEGEREEEGGGKGEFSEGKSDVGGISSEGMSSEVEIQTDPSGGGS